MAEIGTSPWLQMQSKVNNYWTNNLLLPADFKECMTTVDEFAELYYQFIEGVLLKNQARDLSSNASLPFPLRTPAKWTDAIRLLYRTIDKAKQTIDIILEDRASKYEKKKAYCKDKSVNDCDKPCEIITKFTGSTCNYKNKYEAKKILI